jgi:Cu(I)/Ag(I) efflux system protein CusF
MAASLMRPFGAALFMFTLTACTDPVGADIAPNTPVLGIDLGGSGPVTGPAEGHASTPQYQRPMPMAHGAQHGTMQMAHGGHGDAHGTGTINSVDPAQHKINISHAPIPAIGFPAMTMDFAVAPSVNLGALKPGMRVDFTIEQGAGSMYQIQSVSPAGGKP